MENQLLRPFCLEVIDSEKPFRSLVEAIVIEEWSQLSVARQKQVYSQVRSSGSSCSACLQACSPQSDLIRLLWLSLKHGSMVLLSRSDLPDKRALASFGLRSEPACPVDNTEQMLREVHESLPFLRIEHVWSGSESATGRVRSIILSLRLEELEVLCLSLNGTLNKTVARRLNISERTVESRRRRIFEAFEEDSMVLVARKICETIGCEEIFRIRDDIRSQQ